MTLNSILNTGLSALLANQTALSTTSQNISNVNTPNYVRRTVNFESQSETGLGGVDVSSVNRAVDTYLDAQQLTTTGEASQTDAADRYLDQLQASLGTLQSGRDPSTMLSSLNTQLAQLSTDPSSAASRGQVLQSMQNFAQSISTLADKTQSLRGQADQEIGTTVTRINQLTSQIASLNAPIQQASFSGDSNSTLLDQRDAAVRELSGLIDIKVTQGSDNRVDVSTTSGYSLVSSTTAQAAHLDAGTVTTGTVFPDITVQAVNPTTGAPVGPAQSFASQVSGGSLRGLLDLRDKTLPDIATQLGSLASNAAQTFNAASNASSTYPAPAKLTGTNQGLVATDSLGMTGKSSLAVVGADGALVKRVDIDFSAGTLSVDGGAATSFTGMVGGLTTALNTALGSSGSASFAKGQLTLSASGGNGIAVQQDATTPSTSRSGEGFAQTFGLNDVFTSGVPTSFATGLSASDAGGFTAGQTVNFSVRDANGAVTKTFNYTVSGTTLGDVVSGLNTAAAGAGSFALDSTGKMSFTPSASGARLEVTGDTTVRGTTGLSLSNMFGLGQGAQMAQATGFAVKPTSATQIQTAQLNLTSSSAIGSLVLTSGDSSGVLALAAAGNSSLLQDASTTVTAIGQAASAASSASTNAAAAKSDMDQRVSSSEGVSLDEELANMMQFQQAYSAGARIVTTANALYDTLLQILQ